MKIRYLFLIIASSLLLFTVGCDDDDDPIPYNNDVIESPESDNMISTEIDVVDIKLNETSTFKITTEGTGYTAESFDDNIAVASVEGNIVSVEGVGVGSTSLMILDKFGRYKIISAYIYEKEQITLDKYNVDAVFKPGSSSSYKVEILDGHGGYEFKVEDPSTVTAKLESDGKTIRIEISGKKEGKTTVTLIDKANRKVDISINMEFTLVPYTKEELDAFMAEDDLYLQYLDTKGVNGSWVYDFTIKTEDGIHTYGWEAYWYDTKCYISFPGDKSVGVYENSTIEATSIEKGTPLNHFEIVKNDGTKFWAYFSYFDEEAPYLHYGKMIQKIDN